MLAFLFPGACQNLSKLFALRHLQDNKDKDRGARPTPTGSKAQFPVLRLVPQGTLALRLRPRFKETPITISTLAVVSRLALNHFAVTKYSG